MKEKIHPCQKCGACCSQFQVSFKTKELSSDSFNVPTNYTVKISEDQTALRFKNPHKKRCVALQGNIGKYVGCEIYANRPSPCRNFKASFEDGVPNLRCDQARAAMQLPPLSIKDWEVPTVEEIASVEITY